MTYLVILVSPSWWHFPGSALSASSVIKTELTWWWFTALFSPQHIYFLIQWCNSEQDVSPTCQELIVKWENRHVNCCSVDQSCLTLCDPMVYCMPGFPVLHHLPGSAQTHVCWVGDAIQPPGPLLSLSSPAFNLSQPQGLFQWVSCLHQVARVLKFQLQYQSFIWIFRVDFF